MTSRRLAAPLTALVLALSACSGGGDEAAAPEEVDPKEAYVEQADEVCSTADADFAALKAPVTPGGVRPVRAGDRRHRRPGAAELAALTPPEQDRAELESKVLTPSPSWSSRARPGRRR
jgi:hypothetical protein